MRKHRREERRDTTKGRCKDGRREGKKDEHEEMIWKNEGKTKAGQDMSERKDGCKERQRG